MSKHESDPIGSAARDATASSYIGKKRASERAPGGRTLEFHFGAITHQHIWDMGQAEAHMMLGSGSPQDVVKSQLSAKAVGMNIRKPGVKVKVANKPAAGTEIHN